MRKLVNRLRLLKDYSLRNKKATGLPLELVIEVTNKCNLKCVMCTRGDMKRPIGNMEMNLYKKIIDDVSPYIELIYLHGLGEPLFHPKIFEMIKYAKKKNVKVGLSTNGTIMTEEKARRILSCGLDYLIISLDAVTPRTYKIVRGGGGDLFGQLVINVKKYLELKKKAKNAPFTTLQFIKLGENEKEAIKFEKMWKGMGADVIRIKPVEDLLRKDKARKLPHRPCYYIWRQLNMVSWDGRFVTPCCMDSNGDYPLGDARKESIEKIWNSPKMIALRKAQLTGDWKKMQLCKDCTYIQPSFVNRMGAMIIPDILVKRLLPFIERNHF